MLELPGTQFQLFLSNTQEHQQSLPDQNDARKSGDFGSTVEEGLDQARVLFAYEAQDASCLDLKPDDIVTILEIGDGPYAWWRGRIGTRDGWFPSAFVEVITVGAEINSARSNRSATAARVAATQLSHRSVGQHARLQVGFDDTKNFRSSDDDHGTGSRPQSQNLGSVITANPNRLTVTSTVKSMRFRSNTFQTRFADDGLGAVSARSGPTPAGGAFGTSFAGGTFLPPNSNRASMDAAQQQQLHLQQQQQNQVEQQQQQLDPHGPELIVPPATRSVFTIQRNQTIRAHEPVKEPSHTTHTWRQTLAYHADREGAVWAFFAVYIAINAVYFGVTWYQYRQRKSYHVLKNGLTLARSSGALLKMNCALIFIPVCRGLITWARGSESLSKVLPLDSNLKVHKYIAYWIWILSTVHCFAHVFNFNKLSEMDATQFKSYFPTVHKYNSMYEWLFLTLPGVTGVLIWLAQMLMYSSAMKNVRHLNFEVFWFTHHLFIAFTLLTAIHGAAAVFEPPGFWKWMIGPVAIYSYERFNRYVRGSRVVRLDHISGENSGVIALYMQRHAHTTYLPGQYLFLNCPTISKLQWHPFTITSSPEEKFLSCHIKAAGSWTKGLHALLNPDKKLGYVEINQTHTPAGEALLRVDGPYGTPSQHVWDYRVLVLIGAGIGITPYASILKSIFYKLLLVQSAPKAYLLELMRIQKVHFYWICRDRSAFEWFAYLLRDLEVRSSGLVEVHTYMTAQYKMQQIKSFAVKDGELSVPDVDALTGLKSKTYYGRPDFDKIFTDMAVTNPNDKIGVFFCGPKAMSRSIRRSADRASTPGATEFLFHKENF